MFNWIKERSYLRGSIPSDLKPHLTIGIFSSGGWGRPIEGNITRRYTEMFFKKRNKHGKIFSFEKIFRWEENSDLSLANVSTKEEYLKVLDARWNTVREWVRKCERVIEDNDERPVWKP